ncbi:MAG: RidA family protein [Bdellovibrionales bacterium]
MGQREEKLQQAGYDLDKITVPKAKYVLLKKAGNLLYSSGALPMDGDVLCSTGKVPTDVSQEKAQEMAALCVANILRAIRATYGSLDGIKQVVKLNGFVNSAADFPNQHLVMNGASELLLSVFGGAAGEHARAAVGVAMLPLNASVEVEVIFELTEA